MASIDRRSLILAGVAAAALPRFASAQATPASSPVSPLPQGSAPVFNVLFIRHGESYVNVLPPEKLTTPDDGVSYPLTPKGVQQVNALANLLGNTEISAIYTSTRLRCIQTADAVAFAHGLDINLLPEIVEISANLQDQAAIFPVLKAWAEGDHAATAPGLETFQSQLDRFFPAVPDIIQQYVEIPKTLVFVAHGGILWDMLPVLFTNLDAKWAFQYPIPNTGIISGRFEDGTLICTSWCGQAVPA